jgi:hypothetical protein
LKQRGIEKVLHENPRRTIKKGRLAAGQNSEPANDWAKMIRWQVGQGPTKDLQIIRATL